MCFSSGHVCIFKKLNDLDHQLRILYEAFFCPGSEFQDFLRFEITAAGVLKVLQREVVVIHGFRVVEGVHIQVGVPGRIGANKDEPIHIQQAVFKKIVPQLVQAEIVVRVMQAKCFLVLTDFVVLEEMRQNWLKTTKESVNYASAKVY